MSGSSLFAAETRGVIDFRMEPMRVTRMLQVAIVIFPNITVLDFIGPYEPLNRLPNVNVVLVSHSKGIIRAEKSLIGFEATATFDEVQEPDIVIVPGGYGVNALIRDKPILDWIRKTHEKTLYTTSVCTGSLLLAAAGILNGLEATCHWRVLPELSKFGAKPTSSRIVESGKIITAAGVSAGIDMGLKLVALLSNDTTCKLIQLVIEYDPQPPFDCGSPAAAGPELVSMARAYAEKNYPDYFIF